jgi:hypothetical protein
VDVSKACGAHVLFNKRTSQLETRRRVSNDLPASPAAPDVLMTTFIAAHPYISIFSFVYSFMLTLCRAVLILNHVDGYGNNIWADSREGTDVFRFFALIYIVFPSGVINAARDGAGCRPSW